MNQLSQRPEYEVDFQLFERGPETIEFNIAADDV